MKNLFDDCKGIPCPLDYEAPPTADEIERAKQIAIAKRESDLEDWLYILEFVSEFDDGSTDIMVYDELTDSELPLYVVERRTIANLKMIHREIAKGTADRYANILEYCDWHLSSELQLVTWKAVIGMLDGELDDIFDESYDEFFDNYKEGPDEDIQFDLACDFMAFDYIVDVYAYFYITEVLGLESDIDYTPSPYRRGGKGYRLVK